MKYAPLGFPVVPHEDGVFAHHLDVGTFPYGFIFPSAPGPFVRYNEEVGISREVVDILKHNTVKFTCVAFQFQDDGAYHLGLDDTPNAIDFCIVLLF